MNLETLDKIRESPVHEDPDRSYINQDPDLK